MSSSTTISIFYQFHVHWMAEWNVGWVSRTATLRILDPLWLHTWRTFKATWRLCLLLCAAMPCEITFHALSLDGASCRRRWTHVGSHCARMAQTNQWAVMFVRKLWTSMVLSPLYFLLLFLCCLTTFYDIWAWATRTYYTQFWISAKKWCR